MEKLPYSALSAICCKPHHHKPIPQISSPTTRILCPILWQQRDGENMELSQPNPRAAAICIFSLSNTALRAWPRSNQATDSQFQSDRPCVSTCHVQNTCLISQGAKYFPSSWELSLGTERPLAIPRRRGNCSKRICWNPYIPSKISLLTLQNNCYLS